MSAARSGPARDGFALAEAVFAIAITSVVAATAAVSLSGAARIATAAAERAERADARRTVATALRTDVSVTTAADVSIAPDTIRLRVFRGAALVCDTADGTVLVRYRGARRPEPEKDSVLAMASAVEMASPLAAAADASAGCIGAAGESIMRWTGPAAAPGGTVLLLFETGTYALSARALRYRRGGGGRQPLTAEVFGAGSGFETEARALGVRLDAALPTRALDWPVRLRIPLLNAGRP